MKLMKYQKEAIVTAIMADVPKPDKEKRYPIIQAAVVKAMSSECRKLFKNKPEALVKEYIGHIAYDTVYSHRYIVLGDAPKAALEAALKPFADQDEARHKAEKQLEAAVMGCGTLASLKKTFPEFTKYYPSEEQPTKNVPALANVVADISKLGWPKKGAK